MSRHRSAAPAISLGAYDGAAADLAALYESTSFEAVHSSVLDLMPSSSADVLDVGSGSGRDAAAMAAMGHSVIAVEPSAGLMGEAVRRHGELPITWVADALPRLASLGAQTFDLLLLSAVWMYVPARARALAMRRVAELTRPGGLAILTLRRGPDQRSHAPAEVRPEDVLRLGSLAGLSIVRAVDVPDALERKSVSWSSIVLRKASF